MQGSVVINKALLWAMSFNEGLNRGFIKTLKGFNLNNPG